MWDLRAGWGGTGRGHPGKEGGSYLGRTNPPLLSIAAADAGAAEHVTRGGR